MPGLGETRKEVSSRRPRELPGPNSRRVMAETPDGNTSESPDASDDESSAPPAVTRLTDEEALKRHLPEGSVYIWAAKLDGASTSDAFVGWIILLVSVPSCCVWHCNIRYTSTFDFPPVRIDKNVCATLVRWHIYHFRSQHLGRQSV